MAFDNLNYSTENMDDNSVQDRIDALSASVRNDLSALKQETLITSLGSGRVDIRDSWSFLYFRDRNGNEIGRLDDNTNVTILDDHIFWEGTKVFLHVRLDNGRIGYVSADYIKAESEPDSITGENPDTPNPDRPTTPRPEGPTQPRPEGPTIPDPENPTQPNTIEDTEVIPHASRAWFRDGQPYLIAPDGTIEMQELDELPNLWLTHPGLTEYLMIWVSKAQQEADWIFGRYFRDDDEIISEQVENVLWKLIELETAINQNPRNTSNEDSILNEIFDFILIAEWQEAIISNHEEIHTLLLDDSISPERKRLRVYHLSREWILDHGNANEVQNLLADELLQADYENIQTILDSDVFLQAVLNGDTSSAAGFIESTGIDRESAENLAEKYTEKADSIWHRLARPANRDLFREDLDARNNERSQLWLPPLSIDDIISQQRDIALIELMRHSLLRANIALLDDRWDVENSFRWMYAGVSWLSRENSFYLWDALNISDGNISSAIELSVFAVTTLLTMWTWALAIGWARLAVAAWSRVLAGARFANSSNRAIRGLQYAVNGWWRSMSAIRTAAGIGTEGVLFYEWMNLAQNMISENEMSDFLNWWDDTEGIAKSIYMVGVFRMFSVLRAGWQIGRLGNVYDRIPNSALRQAALLISEGTVIYGWEEVLLNGFIFDEGISFTWSELIQTIALVWILRWAGPAYNSARQRIISRGRDGEIILLESPTASAIRRAWTATWEAMPTNTLSQTALTRLQWQSFITDIRGVRTTTTFEGPSRISFRRETWTQWRFGTRDNPLGLMQTLQREWVELFIFTGRWGNSGKIFIRRNNNFYDNQWNLAPNINRTNLEPVVTPSPTVAPAPTTPRMNVTTRQPVSRRIIFRNRRLNETRRLEEADRLLWTSLSTAQREAIMQAHNTSGIRAKIEILSAPWVNWQPLFNIQQRGLLMRHGITGRPIQADWPPVTRTPQAAPTGNSVTGVRQTNAFQRIKENQQLQAAMRWQLNTWPNRSILAMPLTVPVNITSRITRYFISHPAQIAQNIRNAPGIPWAVKETLLSVLVSPNHASQWLFRNMMSFALTWIVPIGVSVLDHQVTWDYDNIAWWNSLEWDLAENFFMWNVLGLRIALLKELAEQWFIEFAWDFAEGINNAELNN